MSRLERAALLVGALVHVEHNSQFSGKVGVLANIDLHHEDGDFYGVQFAGQQTFVYFWAHELHMMALASAGDHHQQGVQA
jgi:hypothetical protein